MDFCPAEVRRDHHSFWTHSCSSGKQDGSQQGPMLDMRSSGSPQGSVKKLERKAKVNLWVAEVVEGEDGSRQRWVLGQGPSRQEDPGLRACVNDVRRIAVNIVASDEVSGVDG